MLDMHAYLGFYPFRKTRYYLNDFSARNMPACQRVVELEIVKP
jgi:hypothetical protein